MHMQACEVEEGNEGYQVEFLDPKTGKETDANVPSQVEVEEPQPQSLPNQQPQLL